MKSTVQEPAPNAGRTIALRDAFMALEVLSDQESITGLDNWRHSTGSDSLATFDKSLTLLVQKQPPTKFGHTDIPSLWAATHFYLALPALSYALNKYGKEDPATCDIVLGKEDLTKYFVTFPHIARHYQEYEEFVRRYGEPTKEWWDDTLRKVFAEAAPGTSAAALLQSLPEYLQERAGLALSDQTDSLVGRIILAYLLGQGTHPEALHFDKRTAQYLAPIHSAAPTMSLYERLIAAQQEFGELKPYLGQYSQQQSLRLDAFLGLVSWYARPHLVEMVIPGLNGAARPAIRSLSTLFAHIIEEGGPDYTKAPLDALPSTQKFRESQSLEAIGRLSIVKDVLSTDRHTGESEGTVLRKLGKSLYGEAERQAAWSNTEYYIPDTRKTTSFGAFRQDIANIIYCAGLFAASNNMAGTIEPETLKELARTLKQKRSISSMRTALHSQRRVVDALAMDWEVRYAGHERLRLLRFVRQTFGLDTIQPIAIPLSELNKGFAGSYYESHQYHLHYREAGEKLEMVIPTKVIPNQQKAVRYHTSNKHEKPHALSGDLPYSAWLEISDEKNGHTPIVIPVPGRGSFDPFGRTGSPHAGEVIGFGCSVHHASLAIILAELASLGAGQKELKRVTSAFMHINRKVHERNSLAAFQLAQIITAFEDSRPYTYRDHFALQQSIPMHSSVRPSLAWAEPQVARLTYGYPTLYPYQGGSRIDPRHSWYDGNSVELPKASIHWQALAC